MRDIDCFRALRLSNWLCGGGFAGALLGCLAGWLDVCGPLAVGLLLAGTAAFFGGAALAYRYVICPHCGEPLYAWPRLPDTIPNYCPHCGEKLTPRGE